MQRREEGPELTPGSLGAHSKVGQRERYLLSSLDSSGMSRLEPQWNTLGREGGSVTNPPRTSATACSGLHLQLIDLVLCYTGFYFILNSCYLSMLFIFVYLIFFFRFFFLLKSPSDTSLPCPVTVTAELPQRVAHFNVIALIALTTFSSLSSLSDYSEPETWPTSSYSALANYLQGLSLCRYLLNK